jgi:probable F420-dependent oxidoreductase
MSLVPIRPFRFGVQASRATSRAEWQAYARHLEDLGYDTLTMPDHLDGQLALIPALMSAADATTRLRIGTLVLDNDFKHPVVAAKELATMDVLSDGRLEIGLGAGWMSADYEQSGIPYDRPGVRLDRLEEGVSIIRRAFGDGPFSHSGTHYSITGYDGLPKPLQRPMPPILIGGGGPRVLRYAARHADIVGVNATLTAGRIGPEAYSTMSAEAVDAKVAVVHEAAGDRLADIEMSIRVFLSRATDDAATARAEIAALTGSTPDEVAASPFALVGTTSHMIEALRQRRERWGFSYIVVSADFVDAFAPVVAALAGT